MLLGPPHFLQFHQPIPFFLPIAERKQKNAAETLGPQAQNFVDSIWIEALHRGAVDTFFRSGDQRSAKSDVGLTSCMLEINLSSPLRITRE